MSPHT